jgi:chromosome segregation ATPase
VDENDERIDLSIEKAKPAVNAALELGVSQTSSILQAKLEIRHLDYDRELLKKELALMRTEITNLRNFIKSNRPDAEQNKKYLEKVASLRAALHRIIELMKEVQTLRMKCKVLEKRIPGQETNTDNKSNQKIKELENKIKVLRQEALDQQHAAALVVQFNSEDGVNTEARGVRELKAEVNSLNGRLMDLISRNEEAENTIKLMAEDAEMNETAIPENIETIRRLTEKITEQAEEILELQEAARGKEPEDKAGNMKKLQEQLYSARLDFVTGVNIVAGLREQVRELQNEGVDLRRKLEAERSALQNYKTQGREQELRIQNLEVELKSMEGFVEPTRLNFHSVSTQELQKEAQKYKEEYKKQETELEMVNEDEEQPRERVANTEHKVENWGNQATTLNQSLDRKGICKLTSNHPNTRSLPKKQIQHQPNQNLLFQKLLAHRISRKCRRKCESKPNEAP